VTSGESRMFTIGSVKAHNRNSLLCEVVVVLSTSSGITSDHSETIGESQWNDTLVTTLFSGGIVTSSLLVIHGGVRPCNQLPHVV